MIALFLASQIVASAPPLAPAEAAAVLARLDSPANYDMHPTPPRLPDGPRVVVISSSATSGPFGAFPKYPPSRPLNCCSSYVVSPRGVWIGGVQVAGAPRTFVLKGGHLDRRDLR